MASTITVSKRGLDRLIAMQASIGWLGSTIDLAGEQPHDLAAKLDAISACIVSMESVTLPLADYASRPKAANRG